MKKLIISFMFMLATLVSANAMNSRDARKAAIFLTDKMAYELNLTMDQYQSVFEINFDYFLNLGSNDDLYGIYWSRRNLDLSYVLGNSKFLLFRTVAYFYRPAYWRNNVFGLHVYSRYANPNRYYYRQPRYCMIYNGEHSWRANDGRSYYRGRALGHYKHRDRYGDYHGGDVVINIGRGKRGHFDKGRGPRDHFDGENYRRGRGNKYDGNDIYFRGGHGPKDRKMKGRGEHGWHGRH